jgi:pimeloyl-ACP methyl ester carboxylesterase
MDEAYARRIHAIAIDLRCDSPTRPAEAAMSNPSPSASTATPGVQQGATPSTASADGTARGIAVVLVHGAFADGSSWHRVIPLLRAAGLSVAAVQLPLSSLDDDVRCVARAIDAQAGPVVLAGHSWGGVVITQAGAHDRVRALVYIAAHAPETGESPAEIGKRFPATAGREGRLLSPDGFQSLSAHSVRTNFAPDIADSEADLIAATQGPIRAKNFEEKVSVAAWQDRPSWYLVASDDRMIHPDAQRMMAARMGATTIEIPSSHVPMLSRAGDVAELIIAAARNVATLPR